MRRMGSGRLLSQAAGLWWKKFPGFQQSQTQVLVVGIGRRDGVWVSSSPLNSRSIGYSFNTKLFARPMATQRSKLEYFQDLHGVVSETIKVSDPSSEQSVVPAQIGGSDGSEGAVLRQRGPRQKYRTASSTGDASQRSIKEPSDGRAVLAGRIHDLTSVTAQRPQRCVAYCTAESYNFERLLQTLQKNRIPSLYFSEVIHVTVPRAPTTHEEYDGQEGDVFYFKDGCVVLWDIAHPQALHLLSELAPFEVGAYERRMVFDMYSEEIGFHYGKQAGILPTGELVLSIGQQNWAKTQVRIEDGADALQHPAAAPSSCSKQLSRR